MGEGVWMQRGVGGVSIGTMTLAKVPRRNAFPNLFSILSKNYNRSLERTDGIIVRDHV